MLDDWAGCFQALIKESDSPCEARMHQNLTDQRRICCAMGSER